VRINHRWSRRLDLSTYDNIFLPINVNNVHWCMAVIRPKAKQLLYLDSLNGESPYCLKLLERFLNDEGKARGIKALTGVWEKIQVPETPLSVPIARDGLGSLGRKSSSNSRILRCDCVQYLHAPFLQGAKLRAARGLFPYSIHPSIHPSLRERYTALDPSQDLI
jgi:hypothetical protein